MARIAKPSGISWSRLRLTRCPGDEGPTRAASSEFVRFPPLILSGQAHVLLALQPANSLPSSAVNFGRSRFSATEIFSDRAERECDTCAAKLGRLRSGRLGPGDVRRGFVRLRGTREVMPSGPRSILVARDGVRSVAKVLAPVLVGPSLCDRTNLKTPRRCQHVQRCCRGHHRRTLQ